MPKVITLLVGLLILLQTSLFAQTNIENFTPLEQAFRSPETVTHLTIDAKSPLLKKFIEQAGEFTALEEVCLLRFRTTESLDAVLAPLTEVPTLKKLVTTVNGIDELPENVKLLNQLTTLEIVPSRNLKNGNYERLKEQQLVVDFVADEDRLLSITYYAVRPKLDEQGLIRLVEVFPNAVVDAEEYQMTAADYEQAMVNNSGYARGAANDGADRTYQPFNKRYQFIQPPIKGVDVERDTRQVKTNVETALIYPSGTRVRIPKDAFVDANGNPVKGAVQVHYREFRDPIDQLVSGIPMTYDTAGVVEQFESAGMFEILASVDGEEVFLAPGKEVKVDFSATAAQTSFNLYAFDDSTGRWEMRGKAGTADQIQVNPQAGTLASSSITNALSNAWAQFERRRTARNVPYVDSTSFDDRYEDSTYFFTYARNSRKGGGVYRHLDTYQDEGADVKAQRRAKRKMRYYSKASIERYRGEKERGQIWFKLSFAAKDFPELANMRSMVWVYVGDKTFSEFRKEYAMKQVIMDMRLDYLDEEELYQITFKTVDGVKTMKAYPRYKSLNYGEDLARSRFAQFTTRYDKRLTGKAARFDKRTGRAMSKQKRIIKGNKDKELRAWRASKKYMSEEEKAMTFDAWLTYYRNLKRSMAASSGFYNSGNVPIVRELAIDGFGVWNCDQIQRLRSPTTILATYEDQSGKKYNPVMTFVIDDNLNGVLQYSGYRGYSPRKFAISKRSPSTILAVDADGNLSYMTKVEVGTLGLGSKKSFRLKMTAVDCGITSVEDLRNILDV